MGGPPPALDLPPDTVVASFEGKKLNYIFQVGLRKEPELRDVPLLLDLAKSDEERIIYRIISSVAAFGRPVATTPAVPKARVEALR